jgi:hypothetical protein
LPSTIERIVFAYVRLKNQRALAHMRDLRQHLLGNLESTSGINPRQALEQVREDLRLIEDGLEQLQPPLGALPENE